MQNKRNFIDLGGAALMIISLFVGWFGPINGLDMIKLTLQHGTFSNAWPMYCVIAAIAGAVLLLIGSLVSSAASLSGIGYFLAVSGFLVYLVKMLIDSKGKIFDGPGTGFYLFLAGGLVLLLRPFIKSR